MGSYSSFAMLALTHHYIVRYAAYISQHDRRDHFRSYVLLGDDICIALDKGVISSYRSVMLTLGVDINMSKSIISDVGHIEFTKRWLFADEVLSPIGARSILGAMRQWSLTPSLFVEVFNKLRVPVTLVNIKRLFDNLS
jgi:hypothetical protein